MGTILKVGDVVEFTESIYPVTVTYLELTERGEFDGIDVPAVRWGDPEVMVGITLRNGTEKGVPVRKVSPRTVADDPVDEEPVDEGSGGFDELVGSINESISEKYRKTDKSVNK